MRGYVSLQPGFEEMSFSFLELVSLQVPLSSTTPVISDIIGNKPHTVIMNKADLAAPRLQQVRFMEPAQVPKFRTSFTAYHAPFGGRRKRCHFFIRHVK